MRIIGMNEVGICTGNSRQEKIAHAKGAFQENGSTSCQLARKNDLGNSKEKKCPFCLIRMMLAGILFFFLIAGFHYNVSLGGFNKKTVEQLLADNTRWETIVGKAMQFVKETGKN